MCFKYLSEKFLIFYAPLMCTVYISTKYVEIVDGIVPSICLKNKAWYFDCKVAQFLASRKNIFAKQELITSKQLVKGLEMRGKVSEEI